MNYQPSWISMLFHDTWLKFKWHFFDISIDKQRQPSWIFRHFTWHLTSWHLEFDISTWHFHDVSSTLNLTFRWRLIDNFIPTFRKYLTFAWHLLEFFLTSLWRFIYTTFRCFFVDVLFFRIHLTVFFWRFVGWHFFSATFLN